MDDDNNSTLNESVRIAAIALDDMRNGSGNVSANGGNSVGRDTASPAGAFVSRVSHLPLVNSAIWAYEHGKASSRVVKYGAEMVESSVKSISRPVIDRLPVNVNQLDEFACRQLDKFDRYRRPSQGDSSSPSARHQPSALQGSAIDDNEDESPNRNADVDMSVSPDREEDRDELGLGTTAKRWRRAGKGGRGVPSWLEANSPFVHPPPPPPDAVDSRASTPTQHGGDDTGPPSPSASFSSPQRRYLHDRSHYDQSRESAERQVVPRSRWHSVLLEAGGLSAALSEESMRRLKYCLQWLQYATAHIDAQILILRDFTASLQPLPPSETHPPQSNATSATSSPSHSRSASSSSLSRPHHYHHYHHHPSNSTSSSVSSGSTAPTTISPAHLRTLTVVRHDIVNTIRQVVDVVSKYAGGALPEPARGRVRGFILKLPQRWARSVGTGASGAGSGAGGDDFGMAMATMDVSGGVSGGSSTSGTVKEERESVVAAAAAAGGTGVNRRVGNRRAGHRERGAGSTSDVSGGGVNGSVGGKRSTTSSRATSPSRHTRASAAAAAAAAAANGDSGGTMTVSSGTAVVAAQRILMLALESLDMMRGVTGVVKDSLDRADAWVERLRTVGLQRGPGATDAGGVPRAPTEAELDFLESLTTATSATMGAFGDDMEEVEEEGEGDESVGGKSGSPVGRGERDRRQATVSREEQPKLKEEVEGVETNGRRDGGMDLDVDADGERDEEEEDQIVTMKRNQKHLAAGVAGLRLHGPHSRDATPVRMGMDVDVM